MPTSIVSTIPTANVNNFPVNANVTITFNTVVGYRSFTEGVMVVGPDHTILYGQSELSERIGNGFRGFASALIDEDWGSTISYDLVHSVYDGDDELLEDFPTEPVDGHYSVYTLKFRRLLAPNTKYKILFSGGDHVDGTSLVSSNGVWAAVPNVGNTGTANLDLLEKEMWVNGDDSLVITVTQASSGSFKLGVSLASAPLQVKIVKGNVGQVFQLWEGISAVLDELPELGDAYSVELTEVTALTSAMSLEFITADLHVDSIVSTPSTSPIVGPGEPSSLVSVKVGGKDLCDATNLHLWEGLFVYEYSTDIDPDIDPIVKIARTDQETGHVYYDTPYSYEVSGNKLYLKVERS